MWVEAGDQASSLLIRNFGDVVLFIEAWMIFRMLRVLDWSSCRWIQKTVGSAICMHEEHSIKDDWKVLTLRF